MPRLPTNDTITLYKKIRLQGNTPLQTAFWHRKDGEGHKDLVPILLGEDRKELPPSGQAASNMPPAYCIYIFKSLAPPNARKRPTPFGVGLFLAGAQGLEPWAYGFGDRRSTNWAIPLYYVKYVFESRRPEKLVGLQGFEPGTIRLWAGGSNKLS